MSQPIIRGIQAVGAVDIFYKYNSVDGVLNIPSSLIKLGDGTNQSVNTDTGIAVAGFRLDSEFLRAVQQIASSLTNNNRTGTLSLTCAKVSTPVTDDADKAGSMLSPANSAIGVEGGVKVYDMVFLAQAQQAQTGGDSVGATLCVVFQFCGKKTKVQFEGCTVANVDPLGLAGNDAANYQITWNYLNWKCQYDAGEGNFVS